MQIKKVETTMESFPFAAAAGKPGFKEAGYVEEEYFMRGTANVYGEDEQGKKQIIHKDMPYCNRFLVRKPQDPEKFSGDIVIEILNATAGVDIDRMWILGKDELMRSGAVYVGITSKPDVLAPMKAFDSKRYEALSWKVPYKRNHGEWYTACDPLILPKDEESETGLFWDMLSDLARYLRIDTEILPEGKKRFLYLAGWSQSVGYMTTYRTFFSFAEDGENLFDGYLAAGGVHTAVTPLNQVDYGKPASYTCKVTKMPVPYIAIQTETENAHFGSYENRQENSDTEELKYRVYELAGPTHDTQYSLLDYYKGDEYLKKVNIYPQYVGENHIPNDYPMQYAVGAIYHLLFQWVKAGVVPPVMPRIEVNENCENVTDEYGNAKGGVRLPQIEAPVCSYINYSDASMVPGGKNALFGHVEPFPKEKLEELYGSLKAYEEKVKALAEQTAKQGFLMEADIPACVQDAVNKASRYGLE